MTKKTSYLNKYKKTNFKKRPKRSKLTDISHSVKVKVFERDNGRCVICGNNYNVMPNSHYIRRSQGGLGIEENIFTACTNFTENRCHQRYDNYQCTDEELQRIVDNFKKHYIDWNVYNLYYKKP